MRSLKTGHDFVVYSNDWLQFAKRHDNGSFFLLCSSSATEVAFNSSIRVFKYLTMQELRERDAPGLNIMLDQPAARRTTL